MIGIKNLHEAPDAATAQAVVVAYQSDWINESDKHQWVFADSLVGVMDAYQTHSRRADRLDLKMAKKWYKRASKASWRPQLVSEFQQLDQGIVPDTVGVQSWLLLLALETRRTELVKTLLDRDDVVVESEHVMSASVAGNWTELLPLVLKKATIMEKDLRWLTGTELLPYTLPYLAQHSTLLAAKCDPSHLRNLKENGIDISDHNNMIRALNDVDHTIETMLYLRDNTDITPDVLETARESVWYWILYASEDERQALLEQSGSWRPLIELVLVDGVWYGDKSRTAVREWNENNSGDFMDLIRMPPGVVRSILLLRMFQPAPRMTLPWPNDELRDLLTRKGELMRRWARLF